MTGMIRTYALMGLIALVAMVACSHRSGEQARLDAAERVMVSHPDSALAIIDSIDASALRSDSERARYALLKSMAIDKNYIDTTTFDILQPAIDYYPRHGSPDERLRTYYYQGRIYQNRHEYDSAMVCFIRGKEYSPQASDTLTAANLLDGQGNLMYVSNIFEDYIELNLIAARMYREIGSAYREILALNKALIGTVSLSQEQRSDSIVAAIEQILAQNEELAPVVAPTIFRYIVFYGDPEDVRDAIDGVEPEDVSGDNMLIDIANAYYNLGDAKNAMRFLEATSPEGKQCLKYKSSESNILDLYGDKAGALEAYREATAIHDSINSEIIRNDLLFLQERYAIEKAKMDELRSRDRAVWASLCIALALLIVVGLVYYRYRISRSRSILQQSENERLLLERDKKALETENLMHRIKILESERDNLKSLMETGGELPPEVREAVKVRIEMLNSLLASQIANNEKIGESYDAWSKELIDNSGEFMNSNRLALQASHPRFIQYLEEHGLDTDEINYACLLAIGLNGREAGSYMKKPSHIHISAAIRKKLDIDRHKTHLAIFIRRIFESPHGFAEG